MTRLGSPAWMTFLTYCLLISALVPSAVLDFCLLQTRSREMLDASPGMGADHQRTSEGKPTGVKGRENKVRHLSKTEAFCLQKGRQSQISKGRRGGWLGCICEAVTVGGAHG